LLNLPGFADIGNTAIKALELHPDQALEITKLAVTDWKQGREDVLNGDRQAGGQPSPQLLAKIGQEESLFDPLELLQDQGEIFSLDDLLADAIISDDQPVETFDFNGENDLEDPLLSLDLMFGDEALPSEELELIEPLEELDFEIDTGETLPDLDDIFGGEIPEITPPITQEQKPVNLTELVQEIQQNIETLPPVEETTFKPIIIRKSAKSASKPTTKVETTKKPESKAPQNLSVRVDLNRLERMNDLVGELAINRNILALQNEQLQGKVRELLNRFANFQKVAGNLRELSDQMVVDTTSFQKDDQVKITPNLDKNLEKAEAFLSDFDALEMDSYSKMHYLLQEILEGMVQLEETVDDITLFSKQANQSIDGQRQMLNHLRDELMWARMLPLGEVLRRFPRVLRDLSNTYKKPVNLNLSGTGVLVDKAVLEKLYDPLLHLLRNAFDHGIELPEERKRKGKPEEGSIEIRAYHKGSQTVIEMRDDGKGINPERIKERAMELGWLRPEQLGDVTEEMLLDLLFKPGFSTAAEVSELSGRGVGLDVVRSQLRSLKGSVSINSSLGKGTSFILQLPLTLTIAKLLVCLIGGSTAIALPADSVEEILVPKEPQIKQVGNQKFLYWRSQAVPIYRLGNLLEYNCPLPDTLPSKVLIGVPTPEDWLSPLLIIRKDEQLFALEVDRLVTEQELVIKPFGAAITPPSYIYGCTILGDGSLIPVIEATSLLEKTVGVSTAPINLDNHNDSIPIGSNSLDNLNKINPAVAIPKVLVVDDSAALRRTLAFTLQKAGYRVLQARDGREALEQLQKTSDVNLIICDIEMPNMNGFEFLGQKRREPKFKGVPVAMLTSRSNDKHRRLAMQLGATAYFSKPYIEQEFLVAIKGIIGQDD
jgi:two-component system, chemotaxis family, sensor histidine kinase and response regulator PixL